MQMNLKQTFEDCDNTKCDMVKRMKASYFNGKIADCKSDLKQLHSHLNKLIGKKKIEEKLSQAVSDSALANKFKDSFIRKITYLNKGFTTETSGKDSLQPDFPVIKFDEFQKVSQTEILQIMRNSNKRFINDHFDVKVIDFSAI